MTRQVLAAVILILAISPFAAQTALAQLASDWYVFQPQNIPAPGEIGMQDWLEKPAGKHGRITRRGEQLVYNRKPIKLWGINLCYSTCSPESRLADKRAPFYAKYGINAVRLHKYADGAGWGGIQSKESFLEFDPQALDRMDYQVAQFKKQGIYVLLSSTFGVKLGPADRKYVPYIDEFGKFENNRDRINTGHGSIYLSTELQQMQIGQIVKILKHKNPYTGLTYAEDPAVAFVELFNEDSALWFGVIGRLQSVPTLRDRAAKRFSEWLKEKYGSHEGLVAAWGQQAIDSFANEGFTGENLDKENIVPAGNPWFYDPQQLAGSQAPKRKRLLDTMLFLYQIQNEFYDKYVKAIRDAGYQGELVGSNWQAGQAFSHYYNLHSDSRVGTIDRHNYFGGGRRGRFNNASMLQRPGSGTLSSGMQQVADRPFMLSEWIHVYANEWGAEGPAIIGAYGMGLQGWDVSFMFQNRDSGGFSEIIGRDAWDVTAPQVLGIFPAVARQVLRDDVTESYITAARCVHVHSLAEGKIGFEDAVTQQYDFKTYDSKSIPAQTLAAARTVVEFTDTYRPTPTFDLDKYIRDGRVVSSTNQLEWQPGDSKVDGFFTIDSPATKAVVGFAKDQSCKLGNVTIKPQSRFAAIYVTAAEPDKDIGSSKRILIVAIARARNTDMKFSDAEDEVLERGKAPILLEPVAAEIMIAKKASPQLYLLDHDGLRTEKTLEVNNGAFAIDGARDKTCYYLLSY
jgi:hypothetical protein